MPLKSINHLLIYSFFYFHWVRIYSSSFAGKWHKVDIMWNTRLKASLSYRWWNWARNSSAPSVFLFLVGWRLRRWAINLALTPFLSKGQMLPERGKDPRELRWFIFLTPPSTYKVILFADYGYCLKYNDTHEQI